MPRLAPLAITTKALALEFLNSIVQGVTHWHIGNQDFIRLLLPPAETEKDDTTSLRWFAVQCLRTSHDNSIASVFSI